MQRRLWNMLQIMAGYGVERFEEEEPRRQLRRELLERGYRELEIKRMFQWLKDLQQMSDYPEQWQRLLEMGARDNEQGVQMLSLGREAQGFLDAVRELGLIDEAMEDDILNHLMLTHQGKISLSAMRRISAQIIFERQFRAGEDYYGIFEEEWKLLFN